jgi:hypothetical protein
MVDRRRIGTNLELPAFHKPFVCADTGSDFEWVRSFKRGPAAIRNCMETAHKEYQILSGPTASLAVQFRPKRGLIRGEQMLEAYLALFLVLLIRVVVASVYVDEGHIHAARSGAKSGRK